MNIQIGVKAGAFDIQQRLDEINSIREWIGELVEWDDTLYKISFHSSGQKIIVWFEKDEHALLFKLRFG